MYVVSVPLLFLRQEQRSCWLTPYYGAHASCLEQRPCPSAGHVAVHVVGRDVVIAKVRIRAERYDERDLYVRRQSASYIAELYGERVR